MSKCKYCEAGDEPYLWHWGSGKDAYYHTTDAAQGLREKCVAPDFSPSRQMKRVHYLSMLIYGTRYAAGNLGAIEFYSSLSDYEKKVVGDALIELMTVTE